MDPVNAMLVFTQVVEAKSFSAAARRLGLSKSAVSKQVARLEDRLGARLINRSTRRLATTEIGAAYYERAQRIATDLAEAEALVTQHHASPRGLLKINGPVSFGRLYLAPAIPGFLERHADVTLDLVLNDRFVDPVEEGYDLVIRIAALEDSSLVARKLAPARRVLCAAPGYLERRGTPLRPAELTTHECLLYSHLATHTEWRFVDRDGKAEAVRVRGRLQANSGDALRGIALGGFGIALMPTFLVGDDILAGRLVHLLPEHENPFGGVYALYPRGRHLSPKVRAFVDYLAESFGTCPPWDRPFTRLEPVAAG